MPMYQTYHIVDVLTLVFVLAIYLVSYPYLRMNDFVIPSSENSLNLNYAYPIVLSGTQCFPSDISVCSNDTGVYSTSACCKLSLDLSVVPNQTVTETDLIIIVILIPLTLLALRAFIWSKSLDSFSDLNTSSEMLTSTASTKRLLSLKFWFIVTWEYCIGLCLCLLVQTIFTNYFKLMVGAPRPTYYALKYWSALLPNDRKTYDTNATESFPSGHSSAASAGLGYIAFIFFADFELLMHLHPLAARVNLTVSFSLLFLASWISVTRIIDYWHFTWDVLAGLCIGFVSALFSQRYVSNYSALKIFRQLRTAVAESTPDSPSSQQLLAQALYTGNLEYSPMHQPSIQDVSATNDAASGPRNNLHGHPANDFETGFAWSPPSATSRRKCNNSPSSNMPLKMRQYSDNSKSMQHLKMRMKASLESWRQHGRIESNSPVFNEQARHLQRLHLQRVLEEAMRHSDDDDDGDAVDCDAEAAYFHYPLPTNKLQKIQYSDCYDDFDKENDRMNQTSVAEEDCGLLKSVESDFEQSAHSQPNSKPNSKHSVRNDTRAIHGSTHWFINAITGSNGKKSRSSPPSSPAYNHSPTSHITMSRTPTRMWEGNLHTYASSGEVLITSESSQASSVSV